jgi:hypothetical protein
MFVGFASKSVKSIFSYTVSRPGLGWLKDYAFYQLPYTSIAPQLVMTTRVGGREGGRESERANQVFILSKGFWFCYSASSNLLVRLTSWLGRIWPRSPLELHRWLVYVLVLNLVLFGDFEFTVFSGL